MNLDNYKKLKFKYKLILDMSVLSSILIGFSIGVTFMYMYASYLGLDVYAPDTGDDNLFEATMFFSALSIVMIYLIQAVIICKYRNWTASQFTDRFLKCKNYPSHWMKEKE
ncbi:MULTISPECIES: hypothetical protein [unclassified Colwellia]|uniref:hypothetical protein n=1 Tax=unclassified Colwellia TaxID=196834 RepID=UPI0015F4C7BE|nr:MULTISPECIES: hypothetical protein [unclassified Colwellia]MBA6381372.1 hypothetical protein [Colwellia sp. BRX10-7]MBA6403842.1 hypothetical protein [Colwellia sp. BRX10-5]